MDSLLRTRWLGSLVFEYLGIRDLLKVHACMTTHLPHIPSPRGPFAKDSPLCDLRKDVWISDVDFGVRLQEAGFRDLTLRLRPYSVKCQNLEALSCHLVELDLSNDSQTQNDELRSLVNLTYTSFGSLASLGELRFALICLFS